MSARGQRWSAIACGTLLLLAAQAGFWFALSVDSNQWRALGLAAGVTFAARAARWSSNVDSHGGGAR